MSEYGTSLISGQHRSVAVSSQGSSSISVLKPKDTLSSINVSRVEASPLSSLSTGDLKKESSDLSTLSGETPVTTVRTKNSASATSISRLGRGILAVREPSAARNEVDQTLSSSGRLTAIFYNARVNGTEIIS